MCFFMVRNGQMITPSITNDVLESITRDTVLQISAEQMGYHPVERDVDRSELYAADEAFFAELGGKLPQLLASMAYRLAAERLDL